MKGAVYKGYPYCFFKTINGFEFSVFVSSALVIQAINILFCVLMKKAADKGTYTAPAVLFSLPVASHVYPD